MNITPGVFDDTLGVANSATLATDILVSIRSKKDELKTIDGAGGSTPESPASAADDILEDQTTLTIKRAWNQQANAQAFVDHFVGISLATATLEEQV